MIKADGLAAGKGVIVAETLAQAEEAEWLLPLIATIGLFGGAMARRRRVT